VFSLKARANATHRRVLAEGANRWSASSRAACCELKAKLRTERWQFAPTKAFDADDFAAFLALLPQRSTVRAIRARRRVGTRGFVTPDFIALLREHAVAPVLVDFRQASADADVTSDFVYARLQRTSETVETGYPPAALEAGQARRAWGGRQAPADLKPIAKPAGTRGHATCSCS